MVILCILGGLLLLLLLLLCARASVDVFVGMDKVTVTLRYLFLRFRLYPGKEAKEKKSKPRKAAKKEKPEKKRAKATAGDLWGLVKSAGGAFRVLRRHLVFSRMYIYLCTGAEDAHQAALRCSQASMITTAALDVLGTLFVLRRPEVVILPGFTSPDIKYEAAARVSIRPLFALAAGLRVLWHLLRRTPAEPAPEPTRV